MRFLILSCNTGEGHNSAARAIEEVFTAQNIFFRTDDALAYLSPKVSKFICDWHVRLYNKAPRLFNAGYRAAERFDPEPETTTKALALFQPGAAKLKVALEHGQYDAVICTHVFAGLMMARVRQEFGLSTPYYFIATDYTCSPFVAESQADVYIIPHEQLAQEFILAGIPAEKLLPIGIPVAQRFFASTHREQSRTALGLPVTGPVILLMGGSMGAGPIKTLVKLLTEQLPESARLVAICGRNQKLFDDLSQLGERPNLTVTGFTREIHLYMDAADLILTKPGGLSTTEAAAKKLPMVFINAVGGCEARNLDFFIGHELARSADSAEELSALVCRLARDPEELSRMRAKLADGFRHNGAMELCRFLQEKYGV